MTSSPYPVHLNLKFAKNRLSLPGPSSEKLMAEIIRLKKTDLRDKNICLCEISGSKPYLVSSKYILKFRSLQFNRWRMNLYKCQFLTYKAGRFL